MSGVMEYMGLLFTSQNSSVQGVRNMFRSRKEQQASASFPIEGIAYDAETKTFTFTKNPLWKGQAIADTLKGSRVAYMREVYERDSDAFPIKPGSLHYYEINSNTSGVVTTVGCPEGVVRCLYYNRLCNMAMLPEGLRSFIPDEVAERKLPFPTL